MSGFSINNPKSDMEKTLMRMMEEHMRQVNPIAGSDEELKKYIQSHSASSDFKESVRAASTDSLDNNASVSGSATYDPTGGDGGDGEITATLASSNSFTLDSVAFSSADNGQRIILKDQVDPKQNGIYTLQISGTSLTLDRAPDFNRTSVNGGGATMFIEDGTTNGTQKWVFSAAGPVVVGGTDGDPIQFVKTSGAPTASNVGAGGAGLFKEMNGDEIRLRNINADPAGRVNVAVDGGTDEIRIDVNEGSLDIGNMTGVIDITHLDNQSNDAVDNTKSTTVSTSFQNKLSLVTPVLQAGDYMVMYTADVGNATDTNKTAVRATIDAVDASVGTYVGTGVDEFQSWGGWRHINLTAATHTINIDYRALAGTAEIQNARIILHRMA